MVFAVVKIPFFVCSADFHDAWNTHKNGNKMEIDVGRLSLLTNNREMIHFGIYMPFSSNRVKCTTNELSFT